MTICALILAAGRSTRFPGANKLLLKIDGIPMIRRVALEIAAAAVDDILVVTRADSTDVRDSAGTGRWRCVVNGLPDDGLSSSIRAGLSARPPGTTGVLIALADMPGVSTALVNELCAGFARSGDRAIIFPERKDGQQGHPVIWPSALFPELEKLKGDTGGKHILARHRDLWMPLAVSTPGAFIDIDTPDDLDRHLL